MTVEPMYAVWIVCKHANSDSVETLSWLIDPFIYPLSITLRRAALLGDRRLATRVLREIPGDDTSRLLRLYDANKALETSLMLGDIEIAKLIAGSFSQLDPTGVILNRITTAVSKAAAMGLTSFLEWLFHQDIPSCWGGMEMTQAARFNRLNTLAWLQENTEAGASQSRRWQW